jgi:hypothetical protein
MVVVNITTRLTSWSQIIYQQKRLNSQNGKVRKVTLGKGETNPVYTIRKVRHCGHKASISCVWHSLKSNVVITKTSLYIAKVVYFLEGCIAAQALNYKRCRGKRDPVEVLQRAFGDHHTTHVWSHSRVITHPKGGFPVLARSSSQLAASACMSTFIQSQCWTVNFN